jgi:hypothetical protein
VQVLLSGLFDALDGAEYVPERDRYLQVLEVGGRVTGCGEGDCLVVFAGPLSWETIWRDPLYGWIPQCSALVTTSTKAAVGKRGSCASCRLACCVLHNL